MRNVFLTIVLIAAVIPSGCRSSKAVLETLNQCDPCFAPTEIVSELDFEETEETATENRSIEDYVQLGVAQNPAVAEARHKIEAMRYRIPQALSLPDPMVNTNTYLAPVETAAGRQAFGVGVSQKITNAERRATQAGMVTDDVAAAEANLTMVQLETAENIRTACYQLLFVRKSIEIVSDDAKSLEQISEVILRQYEVKESVTQQDVLNIQIEQSAIENQLTELRQREQSFQARLARLLNVDPSTDLQILDQMQSAEQEFQVDALIDRATQRRPDLQMQLATINRDRKKIHLAGLENKPDFTVGLNWIATSDNGLSPVRNGDDALLLGIGFNLPVYKNRIRAAICEAQENRRASENRYEVLQDKAAEEVYDLTAKIKSTRDTLDLLQEDIIPKAERTLDLAIDEYSADKVPYVQLIENWRMVLKYRIAEANLQSQHSQLLASLARSIGQLEPLGTQSQGIEQSGIIRQSLEYESSLPEADSSSRDSSESKKQGRKKN